MKPHEEFTDLVNIYAAVYHCSGDLIESYADVPESSGKELLWKILQKS